MGHEQPGTISPVSRRFVRRVTRPAGSDPALAALLASRVRHLASGIKLALLIAILGFAATAVFAVTTGSISGTATDTQGAVLPGVTVHLRNTLTGVVQNIVTDSSGFYNFPSLPLGHYDVTFEKAGFGKYEEADVVINVDTARRVDATLKVGANQQQITVTATQAQVDTVNAQMGEVIGAKDNDKHSAERSRLHRPSCPSTRRCPDQRTNVRQLATFK